MGASASGATPQYQPPPDDPQYLALKARASQDSITAAQDRAGMDSAELMARYGARLTSASAAGSSPTLAAPGATTPAGGTGDTFSDALRLVFGATKVA